MSNTDKNSSLSIYWMKDNSQIHKLLSGECAIDGIDVVTHNPFLQIEDCPNSAHNAIDEFVLLWEEEGICYGAGFVKKAEICGEECGPIPLPFVVSISVMGTDCVQLSEVGKKYALSCNSRNVSHNVPDAIMLQIPNIRIPLIILQYSSIKTSFPKFVLPIK